jgi:PadR family transcriptional regulator PadR
MQTNDLYKGCLENLILQIIHQQGESYGYELTQKAKELSNGQWKITEGTLYPLLHKLEMEETLTSHMVVIGNRQRKYYKLSKKGKLNQKNAAVQLQAFIQQLQQFLTPHTY